MKRLTILIVATLISLSGVAQLKKFKVEIPIKPRFPISDSIQSFTMLNRSMTTEFQNFNNDSLQIAFYKKNWNLKTVLLDSTAADTTIKALGDLLFESQRFDIVIPVDRNLNRAISYTKTPEPLDWNFVEEACATYKTDALIVLENFVLQIQNKFKTGSEYINYEIEKTYYASTETIYRAHWRIYYPKEKKILVDFIMNQDTLFWDSYEYTLFEVFKNLPSAKNACIKTGVKAAVDFSEIIAPNWKEVTRFYYVMKNPSIDQSINLAAKGEWESALQNWQSYAEKGSNSERSKIMLNIALASEMTGNLPDAIEWTKKAQNAYYREVTNFYLKELLLRQTAMSKEPISSNKTIKQEVK